MTEIQSIYGTIYDLKIVDNLLNYLLTENPWKNEEVFMYGKHIVASRQLD